MTRRLRNTLLVLLILAALLWVLVYNLTWHPEPREQQTQLCNAPAPTLIPGQALKVMTWNVQYLAGKRYVFWYDLADNSGPDERPTPQDLAYNLDEVARVIRAEEPDVVLLQELDEGAKSTDYQDQLALLRERVIDLYPCAAQAFEWKADFIPSRHIFGSVGRKLVTLSRFQIKQAERLQLPQAPGNPLQTPFEPKRALLTSYLPLRDGGQLAVLNTQLDRYHPGRDTQRQQLELIAWQVDTLEGQGTPWIIGGDFNALPLGQYRRLTPADQASFSPDSDLHLLWDRYPMIPSNSEAGGVDREDWFTHYPNDPAVQGPVRTLDYLLYSPRIKRVQAQVRQEDTLEISDHLPLVARFLLPSPPATP
ncbi:endonuclease/exonuclease/phosphatase family protein [Pseudomonas abieticivorans]|uniref:endonuclease/exonuclease/phosphatase family protein n=1 Tax=Pseudomonas abieticivorans TaxID=2931382 RepID=UPI0020BDAC92|nr:endonuclease/exonuclease/phosphatase family protein [Pseudomonas sp. PIA16]